MLAVLLLAALALPLMGRAQTAYTFTNTTAGTYDWTSAANWDLNGVPASATNATVTLFGDTTTALGTPIVVNNDPATLTVNTLTLNGLANGGSSTAVTLGTAGNTWTLDGTTPTINLNGANNGANTLAVAFYPKITLNQNLAFTGDGSGNFVFAGGISGGKSLTKNGASTLIINSGAAWTGGTTINGGTLSISNTLAPYGTYTINSPGTLLFDAGSGTAHSTTATTVTGGGTLKLASATTFTTSGSYAADTFSLSAGGLIWVTGNVTVSASGSGKGIWNSNLGSMTVDSGSTMDFVEAGVTGANIAQVDALNGSGTVKGGYNAQPNHTVLVLGAANGSGSFSGVIADHGGGATRLLTVQKAGAGTQTLVNANTYTGGTIISGGTLQIGNATALGGTFPTTAGVNQYPVLVGSGAALDLNGQTFANRIITLNGGSLVNNSGTPASLNGVSSGVVKQAVGTSGGTGVSAGATLSFAGGGGSGAAATVLLGVTPATFTLANAGSYTAKPTGVTITGGGGANATIALTWSATSPYSITGFTITSAGSGFTSAPTVAFTGGTAVTPASITADAAHFTVVSTTVTAGGSGYTNQPTATLSSGTGFAAQALLNNYLLLIADSTVGGSGNTTISENILGSGGLTKSGAGTTTLSGVNTYGGATTISGGTLALGTSGSWNTSSMNINAGATLDVSSHATYNLGVSAGLTASGNSDGTSATLKGGTTVTVGAHSVVLKIMPTTTTGDSTHPALNVSAGNLDLTGSSITVSNNSGSPLGVGDYTLIAGGNVTGTLPSLTIVAGSGLAASTVASLVNSSGNLILHAVATGLPATTTSINLNNSWTSPSTYGDALSFDVTVTSGSGTPTGGTVTVKDGGLAGTTIGTGTLVNGAVTITLNPLNALSAGTHNNIVAIYSADQNYLGSSSTALTQLVNTKGVTIAGAAANNKCFDGTTTAVVSGTVVGAVPGDDVSVNPIGAFASSAVGDGIAVTGFSLTGISANNYTLTLQPSGVTANIVTTGIWTNPAGGLWSTAGNWLDGAIGSGSSSSADFSQVDITADTTVNLDLPRAINQLVFGNADATPAANWIVANNGAPANTLTLAGTTPTVTVNDLGSNMSATISAAVTFSTGLVKAGTGTLVLSGTNTWTTQSSATTIINDGTLAITGPWVPTGANTINAGATMILGGAASTSRSSQTTTFQGAGTLIVTNSISFPNNLNPTYGAITFDLSGGGLVWVTGGATVTGSANGKGYWANNYSSLTVDAGSTIDFAGAAAFTGAYSVQFDALNGGGTIRGGMYPAPNNTVLVLGASDTSGNFSGSMTDHGNNACLALNKIGAGTQTLSGSNTFVGGTTISGGTLQIGNGTALGGAFPATVGVNQYPVLIGADATLDLNGQAFTNRIITSAGGSLVNNNNNLAASLNGTSSTGVMMVVCTNGGSGISDDATLAITDGGGSDAVATVSLGVTTASFTLASGGSYTNKPNFAVTGGTGAAISVVWSGSGTVASPWAISSFTITQPGYAFTGTPAIAVTGGVFTPRIPALRHPLMATQITTPWWEPRLPVLAVGMLRYRP